MRSRRVEEYESVILAVTHMALDLISYATMGVVYRLLGIPREKVTLRHAEIFLVTTTALIISLIVGAEYWSPLGWVVLIFGIFRILQIISLNLRTLLFDVTTVGEPTAAIKRARWHFVAIGFSFLDTVLLFGFAYQFLNHRYGILNQHFSGFFEYLYYAVITITTIGYGDIHPVTFFGRILVMGEAVVALFFLVLFVSGALARLHRQ